MSDIQDILDIDFEPDIQFYMSFEEYCEIPAVNCSKLVAMKKSPLHFRHCWSAVSEDSPAKQWGRAVHCLLFEHKDFENRYTVFDGRRAGGKWDEFSEENSAKEILSRSQWDNAMLAAGRFLEEPLVQELIASGRPEVSLLVPDLLACKARLDWIASDGTMVDLKTTRNITPRNFGRDFFALSYDIKLGMYRRWLRFFSEVRSVELIVMENEPPFDLAVVPVPDSVLDQGERRGIELIEKLKDHVERDHWPGVFNGERGFLDVPVDQMEDVELTGATDAIAEI